MPLAAGGTSTNSGFGRVCTPLAGEAGWKPGKKLKLRALAKQALPAIPALLTNCRRVHRGIRIAHGAFQLDLQLGQFRRANAAPLKPASYCSIPNEGKNLFVFRARADHSTFSGIEE